jgi:hypothetical protein
VVRITHSWSHFSLAGYQQATLFVRIVTKL